METWRPVPSFPDYEASDAGRVRRATPGVNTWAGRVLTQTIGAKGYAVVGVTLSGKLYQRKVHSLVCEAFHGANPGGLQVAHGDGNKLNNRADNLRWSTSRDNHADRVGHGTAAQGERNGRARLTTADVAAIRQRRVTGTLRDVAALFGVSVSTIGEIRRKKAGLWPEVPFA